MDLDKALFSELEIESFNNYLYKVLTDKTINLKNRKPEYISISDYEKDNNSIKSTYIIWNFLFEDTTYSYKLEIEIENEIVKYIKFSFTYKLYEKFITLSHEYMTNKNIKLLMQFFYKWTNINYKQYKYNYNK